MRHTHLGVIVVVHHLALVALVCRNAVRILVSLLLVHLVVVFIVILRECARAARPCALALLLPLVLLRILEVVFVRRA